MKAKLRHDIRIDFEATAQPVKGLAFETIGDEGKTTRRELSGGYIPEPRVLPAGIDYFVDGWWHILTGTTWREAALLGNPGAMQYAMRREAAKLPDDDYVLYGHTRGFDPYAYLLHASEVTFADQRGAEMDAYLKDFVDSTAEPGGSGS